MKRSGVSEKWLKPAAVFLEVDPVEGCPAVHVAEDHTAVLLAKQAADNLQLPF